MRQIPAPLALLLCAWLATPAVQARQHADHAHAHTHASGHAHGAGDAFPDPASATAPEGLLIRDCWIRAMPAGLPSAAYFRMENTGDKPLTLHAARSPVFGHAMLHTSQGGGMKTLPSLPIPVGGALDFSPRGNHVMLEQPSRPPQPGETLPLSFWFGGSLVATADCAVKPAGTLQ
ncbi:copper chaperone PCu(A)C [Paracandidimonas soli]|uniref:Copper(I)-binding protein n=1 Tax=Paracandidimonas soli TaxID=1917182 RepID=A0A4R3V547_9BURK|nr:copper chaperone PCu(A)C [Paracandidimonas soli]TCU98417.1 hypothetical protein EV686_105114 [Paracandidimonas soli]